MGLEKLIERKKKSVEQRLESEVKRVSEALRLPRFQLRVTPVEKLLLVFEDPERDAGAIEATRLLAIKTRCSVCACLITTPKRADGCEEKLSLVVRLLEDAGVRVSWSGVIVREGSEIVDAVLDLASEKDVSLIVVPRSYLSKSPRLSWHVEQLVACDQRIPIFVADSPTEEHFNRALVAITTRETRLANLELAMSVVGSGGEIHLVSVVESGEVEAVASEVGQVLDTVASRLKLDRLQRLRFISSLVKEICDVETFERVEIGDPVENISRVLDELEPACVFLNRATRPGALGEHIPAMLRSLSNVFITPI